MDNVKESVSAQALVVKKYEVVDQVSSMLAALAVEAFDLNINGWISKKIQLFCRLLTGITNRLIAKYNIQDYCYHQAVIDYPDLTLKKTKLLSTLSTTVLRFLKEYPNANSLKSAPLPSLPYDFASKIYAVNQAADLQAAALLLSLLSLLLHPLSLRQRLLQPRQNYQPCQPFSPRLPQPLAPYVGVLWSRSAQSLL
jgi:hypothetical protein